MGLRRNASPNFQPTRLSYKTTAQLVAIPYLPWKPSQETYNRRRSRVCPSYICSLVRCSGGHMSDDEEPRGGLILRAVDESLDNPSLSLEHPVSWSRSTVAQTTEESFLHMDTCKAQGSRRCNPWRRSRDAPVFLEAAVNSNPSYVPPTVTLRG